MPSKLFEKFYQQIEALIKATAEKNFPNKKKLCWDLSMSARQTIACNIKFPGKLRSEIYFVHWKNCKLGRYSRNLVSQFRMHTLVFPAKSFRIVPCFYPTSLEKYGRVNLKQKWSCWLKICDKPLESGGAKVCRKNYWFSFNVSDVFENTFSETWVHLKSILVYSRKTFVEV